MGKWYRTEPHVKGKIEVSVGPCKTDDDYVEEAREELASVASAWIGANRVTVEIVDHAPIVIDL